MDDILKHLYYGNLNELERSTKDLQKTKEFKRLDEAYNALQKALSEKQKELFEAYYFAHSGYASLQEERLYTNGVKTGMQLVIASMDFTP